MVRYSRANLYSPPARIILEVGDLGPTKLKWTQAFDMWYVIILLHEGHLTVSNYVYPFTSGDVAFIPPGKACEFGRVGEGCLAYAASFDLVGTPSLDQAALPIIGSLGNKAEHYVERFHRSRAAFSWTIGEARAWVWDLMWLFAESPEHLRQSPLLFDAEDHILSHLGERLSVKAVAEAAKVSTAHLLRLFLQEHGLTVQQYIRDQRIAEARRLLTTTDEPIKGIAHRVGLPDLQYFNKLIRWSTGYPPRELRSRFRGHEMT